MRLTKQVINRFSDRKITACQALKQLQEILYRTGSPKEWTRAYEWIELLKHEIETTPDFMRKKLNIV